VKVDVLADAGADSAIGFEAGSRHGQELDGEIASPRNDGTGS
jgi:hypothetical protein